jgi:hypothetical protein
MARAVMDPVVIRDASWARARSEDFFAGSVMRARGPEGARRSFMLTTTLTLERTLTRTKTPLLGLLSIVATTLVACADAKEPAASSTHAQQAKEEKATRIIYRSYHPTLRDHLQGAMYSEGAPDWRPEGAAFRVYADSGDGLRGLYRCRVKGKTLHFLSEEDDCEGQVVEHRVGFVSTEEKPDHVPIYRCYDGKTDHLTTVDREECDKAGFTVEGMQGYVLPIAQPLVLDDGVFTLRFPRESWLKVGTDARRPIDGYSAGCDPEHVLEKHPFGSADEAKLVFHGPREFPERCTIKAAANPENDRLYVCSKIERDGAKHIVCVDPMFDGRAWHAYASWNCDDGCRSDEDEDL